MAFWSTNSVNLTCTDATQPGDTIWAIKTALKAAGWTVLGSSDGTANFQNGGSTDYITSQTVANNQSAWIRLREPSGAGGREYVFFRGTTGTRGIIVKYSRSVGFSTGGTLTTLPTTGASGDGVVWLGSTVGFSATGTGTNTYDLATTGTGQQGLLGAISTGYISCVASDTAVNGVYGWWLVITTFGTGTMQFMWFTEGMDAATCSPLDYDPSIRQYAALSAQRGWNTATTQLGHYWNGYPAVWASPTTATYRLTACPMVQYLLYSSAGNVISGSWPPPTANGVPALSPYNQKSGLLPIIVYNAGAVVAGLTPKGFTSGLRITYGPFNACDTFDLTTSTPYFVIYASGIGGGAGACVAWVVMPWVPNVLPLV